MKIVIDAGHEGIGYNLDPGAKAYDGSYECDIVLSVSKEVYNILKRCGVDVYLTRNKSESNTLYEKVKYANDLKADYFISIHGNSFNGEAHGIETFCYSKNILAENIHNTLISYTGRTNRGLKEHPAYYVLRKTNMKAALTEIGFIDNKGDFEYIMSHIGNIASAIAKGILKTINIQYVEEKKYKLIIDEIYDEKSAKETMENLKKLNIKSHMEEK